MSTYQLFGFITVDLNLAIIIDLLLLLTCSFLLMRHGRLAHSHPATIYIFFHVYTVSTRLWGISGGSKTLFDWGWQYLPITEQEIIRAAIMFDIALVVMTFAWVKAAADDTRRQMKFPVQQSQLQPTLSITHIWRVVVIIFPVGLVGLFLFARLPGVSVELNMGSWNSSSWLTMLQTWPGLALLALIYWYGFRKPLLVLMTLYLLTMGYQGFHRMRMMIPLLMLIQIYLDQHNRRWPSLSIATILLIAFLIFFPLKSIGRLAQQGATIHEISTIAQSTISSALEADAPDQKFLDQFAAVLTLTDIRGKFYFGTTYLSALTLPIPRPLWPDKPGLVDYIQDISTNWRPMARSGMIVTFLGEAYVNFWYPGVVLVPFLMAYGLARFYFRAYRHSFYSVTRFVYLMVGCNLILIYRDGLITIVTFVLVTMMPLVFIVFPHLLWPLKNSAKRQKGYFESPINSPRLKY